MKQGDSLREPKEGEEAIYKRRHTGLTDLSKDPAQVGCNKLRAYKKPRNADPKLKVWNQITASRSRLGKGGLTVRGEKEVQTKDDWFALS